MTHSRPLYIVTNNNFVKTSKYCTCTVIYSKAKIMTCLLFPTGQMSSSVLFFLLLLLLLLVSICE